MEGELVITLLRDARELLYDLLELRETGQMDDEEVSKLIHWQRVEIIELEYILKLGKRVK